MSNPFYILYNKVKGDEDDLNAICASLMTAPEVETSNDDWSIVNHAIKTSNEGLMEILSQHIDPYNFYQNFDLRDYERDEIVRLYKMFGGNYYRKGALSPISFNREDIDIISHIMKNGKFCRQEIIDDICSIYEEYSNNNYWSAVVEIKDIIDIDNNMGRYYNLADEINLLALKLNPESVQIKDLDLNYEDKDGNTALMIACEYNMTEIVEDILIRGGFSATKNSKGVCALFHACRYSNLETFKKLVERIDEDTRRKKTYPDTELINYRNEDGNTPLLVSCKYRNKEIVQYLLEHTSREDRERGDGPIIIDKHGRKSEYCHYDEMRQIFIRGAYFVVNDYDDEILAINRFDKESGKLIEEPCIRDVVEDHLDNYVEKWSKIDGEITGEISGENDSGHFEKWSKIDGEIPRKNLHKDDSKHVEDSRSSNEEDSIVNIFESDAEDCDSEIPPEDEYTPNQYIEILKTKIDKLSRKLDKEKRLSKKNV